MGVASDAGARFSELEIAPDRRSQEWRLVEGGFFVARFGSTLDLNAETGAQFRKTGVFEVGTVFVPNDDPLRVEFGGDQTLNESADHGGAGAARRARSREYFDADDILGRNQAEPGRWDVGFAGQLGEALVNHALETCFNRLKRAYDLRILDCNHAGSP